MSDSKITPPPLIFPFLDKSGLIAKSWGQWSVNLSTNAQQIITTQTAPTHQWFNSFANGTFGYSQPLFSDISGQISTTQEPATTVNSIVDDTNITGTIADQALTFGWAGTLAADRLNANVVQAIIPDANIIGFIAAQTLTLGWAGYLPVSRGGTGTSTPSLVPGSNISITGAFPNQTIAFTGTLPSGAIPTPTPTTLGGLYSQIPVANNFLTGISTGGYPTYAQVLFANLGGAAIAAQLPSTTVNSVTNDTNITGTLAAQNLTFSWAGTLAAARLNSNVVQAITPDTNIQGSIAGQTLTFSWAGTLAKARQYSTTVYTDQANSFGSAYTQTFAGPVSHSNTLTLSTGSTSAGALLYLTASSNMTGSNVTAANLIPTFSGTGLGIGINSQPTVSGTTLSYAYAMQAGVIMAASATLANNAIGVNIKSPSMGASSTITNAYGLYVSAQAASGITTAYGIYQAGSSDTNYFAGPTTHVGVVTVGTLKVTSGSNTKIGSGTLVGGTVTIGNTSVTANSKIFVTPTASSATSGVLAVTTKTAGTSFAVKSSNASDTSTFDYFIVET